MIARWAGIDPSLYFVTDTVLCAQTGRTVAEIAAAAVAGGAGLVQVRDKSLSDPDFLALTRQVLATVKNVASEHGCRVPVVVNDRVEVARQLLDEGEDIHVHVGQADMPVVEVRRRLGARPLIGLSAATIEQIAGARASGCVDLIGISPAFDTQTKSDAGTGLGLERIRQLAAQSDLPCVAIGGIDEPHARLLHGSGVVGVCVVSAICLAPDPQLAARRIREAFISPAPSPQ